jgi:nucleoid-associated protein YgaU
VKNFRSNLAGTIDFKPEEYFTEKELRGMSRIGALGVALAKEAGQMSGLLDGNFKLKNGIDPLKAGCTVSSGIGATSKMVEVNEKIYWKVDEKTGKVSSVKKESQNPKNSGCYVVKQGDTLWSIAKKFYNDGTEYTKIYNANKNKISNPSLIYTGQKLVIPK